MGPNAVREPELVRGEPARTSRRRVLPAVVGSFLLGGLVGVGGFAAGQYSVDQPGAGRVEATPGPGSGQDAAAAGGPAVPSSLDGDGAFEPVAEVARAVGPSVVQVETDLGQGSGVVYAEGRILTNHHVLADASQVQVRMADGRVFPVEVMGSDPRNDVAVLATDSADLPVAIIGSSAELEVGQLTVAIGSPFQLQQTVTAGIVSSLNRPVPNNAGSLSAMIQTDAPINPGNSGGALANRAGEVVGINASIRTDGLSSTNVGIGFAIPIDTAIGVAQRIEQKQSIEPGVLGVTGGGVDDGVGVPITEVVSGSAAAVAGVEVGDRILTIDDAPVTDIGELVGLVQSHFAGDVVELQVLRGTSSLTLEATLR